MDNDTANAVYGIVNSTLIGGVVWLMLYCVLS